MNNENTQDISEDFIVASNEDGNTAVDKGIAKAQKAADAQDARDAKKLASVRAKADVKAAKALAKAEAAEEAVAAKVKRVPMSIEEKRLSINAATALRRSTPEGKAYAAAAAAKSYAKKTAGARALKAEAASIEADIAAMASASDETQQELELA